MNWHPTSPLDQTHPDPADVFAAGLALHHLANTGYPIGHLTTMQPYRVPNAQAQSLAPLAWEGIERLGLYVHVPFCEARCGYCEYCVVDPALIPTHEDLYFDLLLREFELWRQAADTQVKTLVGFDIGGGTPSAVSLANIARVVEAARRSFRLPEERYVLGMLCRARSELKMIPFRVLMIARMISIGLASLFSFMLILCIEQA